MGHADQFLIEEAEEVVQVDGGGLPDQLQDEGRVRWKVSGLVRMKCRGGSPMCCEGCF